MILLKNQINNIPRKIKQMTIFDKWIILVYNYIVGGIYMRYIKKNKLTVFIIVIFVVLVFIGAYIYNLFFSSGRKEAYGNRLDGIEEVRISDDTYKQIVKSLKENKTVTDASTDCKGKIVNIIITVTDEETKENAKKYLKQY